MSKKLIITITVAAVALVGAFLYMQARPAEPDAGSGGHGNSKDRPGDDATPAEAYVRENISRLSPEPAVHGGTFYVTYVEARNGTGVVEYEDGHIALAADFAYSLDRDGNVTVSSFKVRD